MSKYVLVVVDMQLGFNINSSTKMAVDKLKILLDSSNNVFRNNRIFTTFVNNKSTLFCKILEYDDCVNQDSYKIIDELSPYVDKCFEKCAYSALTAELLQYLRSNEVDTVYLAGFDTDACVLATAFALFDNNIRPIIIQDCCASTAAKQTMHEEALDIIRRSFGKPASPTVITSENLINQIRKLYE